MIAESRPIQRPPDAKLMVIDRQGEIVHVLRSALINYIRQGDLVVANDAATLPASLSGVHLRTGARIEVRLAARRSLASHDIREFSAIVFGAGDFHLRTEDRPLPPDLLSGDRLQLGPLSTRVEQLLGHPRLITLRIEGSTDEIWAGIAHHGRPIQYAHVPVALALWDVWTPIAAPPVAFEPPSAGFALDWRLLAEMHARGIAFATITHAAGLSSTGDAHLDSRLPLDEPYRIPAVTAEAIMSTKSKGGRVVAVGTTVVRALEHAAMRDGVVQSGEDIADKRLDAGSPLRVVDVILSGTHEPGSSHYHLLRAFANDELLDRAGREMEARAYRTHEFGDSVLIEKSRFTSGCDLKTFAPT